MCIQLLYNVVLISAVQGSELAVCIQLSREGNGTPLQDSCLENPMDGGAWQAAVHGIAKSRTQLGDFTLTFHFHVLEKEMATHSSVLAWRVPGTAEPGGLPSMGSHRVDTTEATQQQQQQAQKKFSCSVCSLQSFYEKESVYQIQRESCMSQETIFVNCTLYIASLYPRERKSLLVSLLERKRGK